jgi:hypothetical protein
MTAIPGAILALAGGMVARTRNFRVVMISVGAAYCIATIMVITTTYIKRQGTLAESSLGESVLSLFIVIFPGLLCLIGALLVRWLSKKSERQVQA